MDNLAITSFFSWLLSKWLKTCFSSIFRYSKNISSVDWRRGITCSSTFHRMPSEKGAVVNDPVYVHLLLNCSNLTNLDRSSSDADRLFLLLESSSICLMYLSWKSVSPWGPNGKLSGTALKKNPRTPWLSFVFALAVGSIPWTICISRSMS